MENYPSTLPRPSRPITYGVKTSTIISEFDSGHSQRRKKAAPKRTFEFVYLALNKTQYAALRDFYIARSGPVEAFYWIDPLDKTTYQVRFNMDTFTGEYKYHSVKGPYYEVAIKLEEAF